MKGISTIQILKTVTAKRLLNATKALSSFLLSEVIRKPVVWGLPFILTIEPTNLCNLRCPQCHTGSGRMNRRPGRMSLDDFKRIIDELGDYLFYLLLYFQGEPYLNEHLFDFIRYAKRRRIYTITSTNGHFLADDKAAEETVTSGLDSILISVDGADQRTYSMYRRGGDFHRVIKGTSLLVEKKIRLKSRTPEVYLQFLIMKHNEGQIGRMRELVRELGVNGLLLKTLHLEDPKQAQELLPESERYRRYRFQGGELQIKNKLKNSCHRLWTSSLITWEGRVSPCCFDKDGKYSFGKLSQVSEFASIWRSNSYLDFRRRILINRKSIDICNNCTQGLKIYV